VKMVTIDLGLVGERRHNEAIVPMQPPCACKNWELMPYISNQNGLRYFHGYQYEVSNETAAVLLAKMEMYRNEN